MDARLPLYSRVRYHPATAGMISRPNISSGVISWVLGIIEDGVLNTQISQRAALLDHVCRAQLAWRQMHSAQGGFFDRGVIPTNLVAMPL